MCEESAAKAEKEIQAQFGKVVDAIAARKEALLKEVAQSVSKHSMLSLPLYSPLFPHLYIFTSSTSNVYTGIAVKEMHGKLENSIKVTKQMLELGASIYPTNKNPAEAIWEVNKEKKTKQTKLNYYYRNLKAYLFQQSQMYTSEQHFQLISSLLFNIMEKVCSYSPPFCSPSYILTSV